MASAGTIFRLGCATACLAVMFGAFGAHALGDSLKASNMTHVYETGVQYQFYHAPPQLAISWLLTLKHGPDTRVLHLAAATFAVGTLLFSGSLYALALSGVDALGIITPFGGVLLIVGWLLLMWRGPRVLARQAGDGLLTVQQ